MKGKYYCTCEVSTDKMLTLKWGGWGVGERGGGEGGGWMGCWVGGF